MEPCKANTVGIVKNSSSLRTPRKTLQFFRACSGFFWGGESREVTGEPLARQSKWRA